MWREIMPVAWYEGGGGVDGNRRRRKNEIKAGGIRRRTASSSSSVTSRKTRRIIDALASSAGSVARQKAPWRDVLMSMISCFDSSGISNGVVTAAKMQWRHQRDASKKASASGGSMLFCMPAVCRPSGPTQRRIATNVLKHGGSNGGEGKIKRRDAVALPPVACNLYIPCLLPHCAWHSQR